MGDYISRETAIKAFEEARYDVSEPYGNDGFSFDKVENVLQSIPAADVKPVRWVPVEDRMPETDKLVLVVKSDGDMAVAGWSATLGWLHYWSGFRVRNVTHWMPLPELPKEE